MTTPNAHLGLNWIAECAGRRNMPMIMLLFHAAREPAWWQRVLRWRQIGPWHHVSMAIRSGNCWEVLDARPGGLRQRIVSTLDTVLGPGDTAIHIPVPESTVPGVRGWWAARIGAPYDAVGIIEIGLGRSSTNKSAWFCSEACVEALQTTGIWKWADAGRVTPQELWAMAMTWSEAHAPDHLQPD